MVAWVQAWRLLNPTEPAAPASPTGAEGALATDCAPVAPTPSPSKMMSSLQV
jgi:hypothetical protein